MRFYLFVALLGFVLSSCLTQRKAERNHNYLEDVKDTAFKSQVIPTEPLIQKGDLLSIQVYSAATDPRVDQLYNLPSAGAAGQQGQSSATGFLVDQQGYIEYPRVGLVHVEGLTKAVLADSIKTKLSTQLTNPSVIIRFLNFRINVLGEVARQGMLSIPTEQVTILEAIGMAGGVTDYGKLKEVKVVRNVNGNVQVGVVDLTSKDLFTSPYYQLQQNDYVMVDKTRDKIKQAEQAKLSQQIGFALSIITSIALLYNIFK